MSTEPWSNRPKVDELSLTDILMRRVPTGGANLNQEIPMSDVLAFLQGSPIVLVSSEADLPALANGFQTLEQGKNYRFIEPNTFTNPILIPAGWIGIIEQMFLTPESLDYTSTTPMFNTLNIDGIIDSVADAGGGAITVTTNVAHGLVNGQFVNITGTTSYNQDRLVISNVTSTTFDVQIAFVANESGLFNTGYGIIFFENFTPTNSTNNANFMDLTATPISGSFLSFSNFLNTGFLSPGIIRDAPFISSVNSTFAFLTDGLTLENCTGSSFLLTDFRSLSDSLGPTANALTITGVSTRAFSAFTCPFTMTQAGQHPVRIDSSVTDAEEIIFQNSPDNVSSPGVPVATDYFDTSSGGLDQTDPQVIAINNGLRADSMTISESNTSGILEVDGSGGVAVPIVDVTPVAGDWVEDPTTEEFSLDTTTGIVTYNGLKPRTVMITYSLNAEQTSGSAQTVDITLNINGTPQTKSTITIITASGGVSGVYNGGNFFINPGNTFQLFKDNTTNTTNTNITNAILLINLD